MHGRAHGRDRRKGRGGPGPDRSDKDWRGICGGRYGLRPGRPDRGRALPDVRSWPGPRYDAFPGMLPMRLRGLVRCCGGTGPVQGQDSTGSNTCPSRTWRTCVAHSASVVTEVSSAGTANTMK
ncbi:hypothetical protein GCM10018793_43650 [Streptomyces sulfonofaciens]|uniref:Uncharacterized protein n=1 Tax=Streptomyces sulfonofaciens TaxID=68272 RepID=A0A919L3T0_9ACTN|nr:hypothetical protein GCM10018793_43650 [Streptomyces sulfonofaciens]